MFRIGRLMGRNPLGSSLAATLLGTEADGVALDFRDLTALVRDTATPANNFAGNVNNWLTYTAPSTKWIRNSGGTLVSGTTLRTEYNSSGTALGVRIEPAATNLLLRSQEIDNAYWTGINTQAFGSGSVANAITAPDGTLTGDFLCETSGTGTHSLYAVAVTISAGAVVTYSKWFKAGGRSRARLQVTSNSGANGAYCLFNLATGAVGANTVLGTGAFIGATIEAWANGWYRCSVTVTVDAAATTATALYGIVNDSDAISYTGDGVSGLYVWGAQVEVGRWASSYIPTTTATVTRAADNVTKLITAMPFSATAGTLFTEFSTIDPDITTSTSTYFSASFNNGNTTDYIGMFRYRGDVRAEVRTASVQQANLLRTVVAGGNEMHRSAVAYAANDVQASVDGTLTAADASATLPTVTRLQIGIGSSASLTGGHMKRCLYVPRRVSNGDLPTFGGTS